MVLCRGVVHCGALCCCVLLCVAVCCSALQCVAVCCSVLQCVAFPRTPQVTETGVMIHVALFENFHGSFQKVRLF